MRLIIETNKYGDIDALKKWAIRSGGSFEVILDTVRYPRKERQLFCILRIDLPDLQPEEAVVAIPAELTQGQRWDSLNDLLRSARLRRRTGA